MKAFKFYSTHINFFENSIFDGPTEKQILKLKNSKEEFKAEYGMMAMKTTPIGNDLEQEIVDVLEDAEKNQQYQCD